MVNNVKKELKNKIGNKVIINYSLGRNKYEKYEVVIKKVYNNVFIVEMELDDNIETKSFSYADVITKTIKIEY